MIFNDFSLGLMLWQIFTLISIGLFIFSLVDILKSSFDNNNKLIWILVVLLVPVLGSILYLFIEKKQKTKLN